MQSSISRSVSAPTLQPNTQRAAFIGYGEASGTLAGVSSPASSAPPMQLPPPVAFVAPPRSRSCSSPSDQPAMPALAQPLPMMPPRDLPPPRETRLPSRDEMIAFQSPLAAVRARGSRRHMAELAYQNAISPRHSEALPSARLRQRSRAALGQRDRSRAANAQNPPAATIGPPAAAAPTDSDSPIHGGSGITWFVDS